MGGLNTRSKYPMYVATPLSTIRNFSLMDMTVTLKTADWDKQSAKTFNTLYWKQETQSTTRPTIMIQIPNWSLTTIRRRMIGCWSMGQQSFYLTIWTPSWWNHGTPSRCQLATQLFNLIPPDFTTNTQAWADSIQVSSSSKAEEINNISCHTVGTIEVQVTRTDNPVVVLWAKVMQQPPRIIILWAAAYDAASKRTFLPIKEMKKWYMMILQQNKLRLVNDKTSRRNPDSSSGIYLTFPKVAQYRLVDKNRI